MKATDISALKKVLKQIAYSCFPHAMRKRSYRRKYERRAKETACLHMPFLNWGYVPVDEKEPVPKLTHEDEPFRLSIQLYHRVANQIDLKDLDVLEVGSGRGGGAYYMKRYLKARNVVGVELSRLNVDLSRRTFELKGLSFRQGDAEALPFQDGTFDAVVNVESSHCYPNLARFFQEVKRVLRPGGHFFYADFGAENADFEAEMCMPEVKQQLKESGLALIKSIDITANVFKSLTLRSPQLDVVLRRHARDEERYRFWAHWSRLVGTEGYNNFRDRKHLYMSFLLQKC
jgi:SAM-dependent methyltransferase